MVLTVCLKLDVMTPTQSVEQGHLGHETQNICLFPIMHPPAKPALFYLYVTLLLLLDRVTIVSLYVTIGYLMLL